MRPSDWRLNRFHSQHFLRQLESRQYRFRNKSRFKNQWTSSQMFQIQSLYMRRSNCLKTLNWNWKLHLSQPLNWWRKLIWNENLKNCPKRQKTSSQQQSRIITLGSNQPPWIKKMRRESDQSLLNKLILLSVLSWNSRGKHLQRIMENVFLGREMWGGLRRRGLGKRFKNCSMILILLHEISN